MNIASKIIQFNLVGPATIFKQAIIYRAVKRLRILEVCLELSDKISARALVVPTTRM